MDAPDGLVGEALSIELGAQQPPALFQIGVELLDVSGGQLVQLDTAQGGDDVLVDPPLIGHLGVGPEVRFLIGPGTSGPASPQGDPWLGSFRGGSLQALPQGLQLGRTFRFRLSKDIFGFGQALLIIADDDAPSQRPSFLRRTLPSPCFLRFATGPSPLLSSRSGSRPRSPPPAFAYPRWCGCRCPG